MKNYLKLMRIHHYIKNILVFAALACSGQLFNTDKLILGIFAFISFCMISSVVYIINDILDRDKDKNHPIKKMRPIASEVISVKNAICFAVLLLVIAIIFNSFCFNVFSSLLLALYLILNIAYSLGLKNIPIIDISILVSGFLIRIIYGALITDITISAWLYLTVLAFSFYFALGKRRNELKYIKNGKTRKVLKSYSIDFLDKNMGMCLTLGNVFYALWSLEDKTKLLYDNNYLFCTVPIVLLISMKYSFNIESESDGDPIEVLLHDKILLILCILYLLIMFLILYL